MFKETFLLQNETAIKLYESIKDLPIIDYHNHLSPKEIYENEPFINITDMWLNHDHYKWRLMRFSGIKEDSITSTNSPLNTFIDYAETLEKAYLNPLYHWSHLELKAFFNIEEILTKDNAKDIYLKANNYLKENPKGPRELLEKMNVEVLCTTDDLNDDLNYHKLLDNEYQLSIKVLPTFRPDKLFTFDNNEFKEVILKLEINTNSVTNSLSILEKALNMRLDYFADHSCKIADHGITHFVFNKTTKEEANIIFLKRYNLEDVSITEIEKLNSYLLGFFLKEYARRKWTVQYHIGALRDNNTLGYNKHGKDTGYDSISGHNFVDDFNRFLNHTHQKFSLPRVIIYPLNSALYEAIATLCANFSEDIPGKIQLGAAWWFLDNKSGIEKQLNVFAEYLNLNNFMGMVTDSRSFLSFVRHDYFRRILANFIGEKVELGLIPNDIVRLIELVQNISYNNSKTYLNFNK